ncbi:hypothetical protein ACE6ED_21950 [Paenibacillus sp. CN-4]|uniref:hypothetical protein n=1 Tax=Paenibacillus nanchangensis TaxID=3348343 RepID=UPI00397B0798
MHGRIELDKSWSREEIRQIAADPAVKIVQYSEWNVPNKQQLKWLNEELFAVRADVALRIYGFHFKPADLSVLELMTEVRDLSVDCCTQAEHLDAVSALPKLESLVLDIYQIESFEALNFVPASLKKLRLGKTASAKPDLSVLRRFRQLQQLALSGQRKNIEVIGDLRELRSLHIGGVPLKELAYLVSLPELRRLQLGFGGAEHLEELAGMDQLRILCLLRVKGLTDLSALSTMQGLRYVQIIDQAKLTDLQPLADLPQLKRVLLENVAAENLEWAKACPPLDELALLQMKTITPAQVEALLQAKSFAKLSAGFKTLSMNKEIQPVLEGYGHTGRSSWWVDETPFLEE